MQDGCELYLHVVLGKVIECILLPTVLPRPSSALSDTDGTFSHITLCCLPILAIKSAITVIF